MTREQARRAQGFLRSFLELGILPVSRAFRLARAHAIHTEISFPAVDREGLELVHRLYSRGSTESAKRPGRGRLVDELEAVRP
jgi:hypothetical protein